MDTRSVPPCVAGSATAQHRHCAGQPGLLLVALIPCRGALYATSADALYHR